MPKLDEKKPRQLKMTPDAIRMCINGGEEHTGAEHDGASDDGSGEEHEDAEHENASAGRGEEHEGGYGAGR